jgi:hypothetical protein
LGKELGSRFPAAEVMDAFGIVYPQYWSERDADANFDRHLKVLKTHYGHGKSFSTASFPEGSLDPVLSLANLDMQATLFKITMKEVGPRMMQKPIDVNPVTRMWRSVEANTFLRHSLSEYIKVAELAVVMVLGSVQDERTFSTLTFMKNKLRNRLTTHLELVVGMKMQNFYTLDNFPYGDAYDSWAAEKKRLCDIE